MPRVLMVGDSVSRRMGAEGSKDSAYESNLDKYGYADVGVIGNLTAIDGRKAAELADPGPGNDYPLLQVIAGELLANPTVDTVAIVVGMRDLLDGAPFGWWVGIDPVTEEQNYDTIEANLRLVTDFVLSIRPSIHVVHVGYSYFNFVEPILQANFCDGRMALMNNPSVAEINAVLRKLEERRMEIAQTNAEGRVHYFQGMGRMQHLYSFPGPVPSPGQSPAYAPFPGGDPLSPGPVPPFLDCLHMRKSGYRDLLEIQMLPYFVQRYRGNPHAVFYSEGGARDGSVLPDGTILDGGILRIGHDFNEKVYAATLSFDTSILPATGTVLKASVFITTSRIQPTNPFGGVVDFGGPVVELIRGNFGATPDLESDDHFVMPGPAPDAADEFCFTGSGGAPGNVNHRIRIDLTPDLLDQMNPDGLTQLRIHIPGTVPGTRRYAELYDGGADLLDAPFTSRPWMDVTYCCPGDANKSGEFVDGADFITVQTNFGVPVEQGGVGDANCSGGFVDGADFIAVQINFGEDCR